MKPENNQLPEKPASPNSANTASASDPRNLRNWWNGLGSALRIIIAAAALLIVLAVAAELINHSNSASQTGGNIASSASVTITSSGFSPQTISVKAGAKVVWTNTDNAPHQVAADPYPKNDSIPGFNSTEVLQPGQSYSFTFSAKGTYGVHDQLNPLKNLGTIKVN